MTVGSALIEGGVRSLASAACRHNNVLTHLDFNDAVQGLFLLSDPLISMQ